MGLARTLAVTLTGLAGHIVEVEAHATQGLPGFTLVGLPDAAVRKQLEAAASRPYETLRREHVAAYRERYERVHLRLGRPGLRDSWPINRRLDAFSRGRRDPSLVALYYQFGRYLLISSTRPGALPPASQGLWCATTHTPDNGAYRLDGPLQMSYWAAETGNLPEAIAPLVEWTRRLSANGRNTAAAYYGARGWTAHTWTNVWDFTAPDRQPVWSASPTAAARLCASLYEHFRFTRDTAYLRSVYPLLRDAALCLSDRLSEDPRSRRLVIAPSLSPENVYLSPNGRRDTFGVGSTVDQSLVRELFTNTLHAASILRTDIELSGLLSAYIARLAPIPLTRDGRIAEWPEPLREAESRTVFVPQLYGLFPSTEISLSRTLASPSSVRSLSTPPSQSSTSPLSFCPSVRLKRTSSPTEFAKCCGLLSLRSSPGEPTSSVHSPSSGGSTSKIGESSRDSRSQSSRPTPPAFVILMR